MAKISPFRALGAEGPFYEKVGKKHYADEELKRHVGMILQEGDILEGVVGDKSYQPDREYQDGDVEGVENQFPPVAMF